MPDFIYNIYFLVSFPFHILPGKLLKLWTIERYEFYQPVHLLLMQVNLFAMQNHVCDGLSVDNTINLPHSQAAQIQPDFFSRRSK